MKQVTVIGGGAAGMMAAIRLAEQGHKVTLLEKNEKLGKKLFITGKGRCNLTNDCPAEDLFANVVSNPKFLYSAIYGFDAAQTISYFQDIGLQTKTERGNRVFPVSDHSSDVIRVLEKRLAALGVEIRLHTEVKELLYEPCGTENAPYEKKLTGVRFRTGKEREQTVSCAHAVVATGGVSYPLTGSTGDGFIWAKSLGMEVKKPLPALVPMCAKESLCRELMGLTLKNVRLSFVADVKNKDKVVYEENGELLFTHFGVSGPVVLSASSYMHPYLDKNLRLVINMKPALSKEQLDARILRDFEKYRNRQLQNALDELLPKRLIAYVIEASGINPYKKVNEITKQERDMLLTALTEFTLHITGVRGFEEAIITQGGVSVKEINPKTMEAKRVKGLYFVGEVLDVDALTGGFNLQIAWSTARAVMSE